ncbi:riboflavin synthase subunit alpha [Lactobacillus pasteurii DSM 23907 = CRBIP 24.76]|uniref:Riboflavin synthase n=1 Tax=Lactobacillus pasteurii DSM 23907 = CRBIP 24.76 TaxID=1423790 RepID=I7J074_9LACO|nr:riboflavin synthase [Lactobacillus pasteurii]KRK07757.1 riboflavin synthase subunit alpha [Lactobacillus pasteurii DSM 23907 = CRBIP 24.76]TDG77521.1 hypothetical protein C5L33_000964 [Lactobacillus pasteurii]CCI85517.1 Riboflavin synthase subunit alpha [Lactobacillus pasteurii DSM 23907 = CRBIP 24.76]
MFSGLVRGDAKIAQIKIKDQTIVMDVETSAEVIDTIKIGDSIAINGTCLTAEKIDGNSFQVTMMPQTFNKTIFKNAKAGDQVNLERSLKLGDRLEGHIVTGHIDQTIKLLKKQANENAIELFFELPKRLANQVIPQGSVALNGVSLTVMDVQGSNFSVGLIPHTQDETNLAKLEVGDEVNLETDILGKYVAQNLAKRGI